MKFFDITQDDRDKTLKYVIEPSIIKYSNKGEIIVEFSEIIDIPIDVEALLKVIGEETEVKYNPG